MAKEFNDKLMFQDESSLGGGHRNCGMWARTEIQIGYDYKPNPTGKSTLGETLFTGGNMVTISGVQYAMEKIFGVKGLPEVMSKHTLYASKPCEATNDNDQLKIGLENRGYPSHEKQEAYKTYLGEGDVLSIGADNDYQAFLQHVGETYQVPRLATDDDTIGVNVHRNGHRVCLFGVGVTGIQDNDTTVYSVDYKDTQIEMSRSLGNSDVDGHMIPFRQTADQLSEKDRLKYFGKKKEKIGDQQNGPEFTSYYLKTFESEPVIKHCWTTGSDAVQTFDEAINQDAADANSIWQGNGSKTNTLETFTEMHLKITARDLKEYFLHLEQEDRARFNTIALFAGRYVRDDKKGTDYGDFEDVVMFSKLIIPVENISLNKDLNIIYRVYGS